MPHTLQDFLTQATQKAQEELVAAYLRVPEDKRTWSPEGKARTALDQMMECAILNGYTANLIQSRTWAADSFDSYARDRAALETQGWEPLHSLLQENTRRVIAAIGAIPDDALNVEIEMPWAKSTLAEVMAYPYWNMSYHQGQINYIASMLGCLP